MKIKKKTIRNQTKLEKILLAVISVYILGIIVGCIIMCIDKESSNFLLTILKNSAYVLVNESISVFSVVKYFINDAVFFLLIFLLKYSGILKNSVSCIPLFLGIKNAIRYCMANISGINLINILINFAVRDTAISFLLILYCAAVMSEIIKKRDDIKYDTQIFLAYISAVLFVYIIDSGLKFAFLI